MCLRWATTAGSLLFAATSLEPPNLGHTEIKLKIMAELRRHVAINSSAIIRKY
jgi:hypothetical protein